MDHDPEHRRRALDLAELRATERIRLASERLALEREKWETEKSRPNDARRRRFAAVHATVLVALLTVIGTVIGTLLQARANRLLEEQKFQLGLIVKVFESTSRREESLRYLRFLRSTGLVPQLTAAVDSASAEDLPQVRAPGAIVETGGDERTPITALVQSPFLGVVRYRLWLRAAGDTTYSVALEGTTADNMPDSFDVPAEAVRSSRQELAYWLGFAGSPGGRYQASVRIVQGTRELGAIVRAGQLSPTGTAVEQGVISLVRGDSATRGSQGGPK
jgi:hypothetical protein